MARVIQTGLSADGFTFFPPLRRLPSQSCINCLADSPPERVRPRRGSPLSPLASARPPSPPPEMEELPFSRIRMRYLAPRGWKFPEAFIHDHDPAFPFLFYSLFA